MTSDGEGAEIGATDLFFSLAAVLIVLLCVTSQTLRGVVGEGAESGAADMAALSQAAPVWLVLAQADGVVLHRPGSAPVTIGQGDILSGAVESWAAAATSEIRVVIAEDAADSAFLLETGLARAGIRSLQRIRLAGACPQPRLVAQGIVCGG